MPSRTHPSSASGHTSCPCCTKRSVTMPRHESPVTIRLSDYASPGGRLPNRPPSQTASARSISSTPLSKHRTPTEKRREASPPPAALVPSSGQTATTLGLDVDDVEIKSIAMPPTVQYATAEDLKRVEDATQAMVIGFSETSGRVAALEGTLTQLTQRCDRLALENTRLRDTLGTVMRLVNQLSAQASERDASMASALSSLRQEASDMCVMLQAVAGPVRIAGRPQEWEPPHTMLAASTMGVASGVGSSALSSSRSMPANAGSSISPGRASSSTGTSMLRHSQLGASTGPRPQAVTPGGVRVVYAPTQDHETELEQPADAGPPPSEPSPWVRALVAPPAASVVTAKQRDISEAARSPPMSREMLHKLFAE